MDGYELAGRFSYITNKLRFCGPAEAKDLFLEYLKDKKNKKQIEEALKKFEGLYPYLSAIASVNNKKFYDFDVVEAYWIGNSLLDTFKDSDIKEIINTLVSRGLPKKIGEGLILKMPKGFVPHHNFNVFYVGVGKITGAVETTVQNMDNCRTSYGRVLEVLDDNLIVKTDMVVIKNKKIKLEDTVKNVFYIDKMLPSVKIGDIVGIHWGFACIVLSEKQKDRIQKYTEKILGVINGN